MIGGGYDTIWRGDSKLASAALKLARHVRTKGRRGGISAELLGLLLELVEFAQGACESPCLRVARMHDLSDPKLENPEMCAESLVMLARDVDAHPWGAFGFVHPKLYLSFLQQLTSLMYKVATAPIGAKHLFWFSHDISYRNVMYVLNHVALA